MAVSSNRGMIDEFQLQDYRKTPFLVIPTPKSPYYTRKVPWDENPSLNQKSKITVSTPEKARTVKAKAFGPI